MNRLYALMSLFLVLCHSAWIAADASSMPGVDSSSAASTLGEIPLDATALCVDNTWSSSKKRSGACSSHGGIKTWFGKPPKSAKTRCNDGTYTKSTSQGTCSSHGGVAYSLKEPKNQD